jgi:predicted SAM-dependent methyltransferase
MLCLGSGAAPIDGWINIDLCRPADMILDLRFGLPFVDSTVDFIYSEHLVEHLGLNEGIRLLNECRRILKPDGVLRFATPDLADVIKDYPENWRRHDWVNRPEYAWIDSGARMVNVAFRYWNHRYLYDYRELALRLGQAGFQCVERRTVGSSKYPKLCNLETRPDSKLVVEAQPYLVRASMAGPSSAPTERRTHRLRNRT